MYKNVKYYIFLHLYTLLSSFVYFYTFSYISLKLVNMVNSQNEGHNLSQSHISLICLIYMPYRRKKVISRG